MRFFLAVFGLIFAMGVTKTFAADPTDNTRWQVKVAPDEQARSGGEKDFDDVLTFKASLFSDDWLAKKGFKPAQFDEDSRRFGPVAFTAEQKSDQQGTAKWTGTITASAISGQLLWTKKDGTAMNFSYTGEKK